MEKELIGLFATSKAGHDKGKVYVIVQEEAEYVYLSDGNLKTIEKPKKKKKKHIQIVMKKAHDFIKDEPQVKDEKLSKNEEIKRAIKLYRYEIGGKENV